MRNVCAKTKGTEKTKTVAEKRNCRGRSQSSQEYDAAQPVTPSADLKFAAEMCKVRLKLLLLVRQNIHSVEKLL